MRVEIYLVVFLLATGSALAFGTRGEKWIGATVLIGNLLTIATERLLADSFVSVLLPYLVLDAVLAVILCCIAVRHPSWVAICVSAFQINGTLGHLVKLFAMHTIPFSYAFLLKVWAWPMVLSMLAARWLPGLRRTLMARDWPPVIRQNAG
jgi:hypothetical protein